MYIPISSLTGGDLRANETLTNMYVNAMFAAGFNYNEYR